MRTVSIVFVLSVAACSSSSGDDATGDDTTTAADAMPPTAWVSSCYGAGCPRGECATLDACDAAGYNGGSFDWESSSEFCGSSTTTDLCIVYDGDFYHVTCAGPTVVRETCYDGCAFDNIAQCAYCAEDPSCAE